MVCLCPLRLAIMLNFNISKVAFLKETPSPGKQLLFACLGQLWGGRKAYLDKLNRRAACIIGGRSIGAEELKSTLGWPTRVN